MNSFDILKEHNCPVGEISYIFTISLPKRAPNIDIVSRCEIASNLVRAGHSAGLLNADPLLIIGGGAAGVSAAITALHLGVDGVHISTDKYFFSPQRGCQHRYIHPYIYRWPEPDCSQNRYEPHEGTGLNWTAGIAASVVEEWDDQARLVQSDGRYKPKGPIPEGTVLQTIAEVNTTLIEVTRAKQFYGMVLLCVGPKEKTSVGSFNGATFWEADQLDKPDCGCTGNSQSVLIVGVGDGALQDLLRVCCPGHSIVSLRECLETMLDDLGDTGIEIRAELQSLHERESTLTYQTVHTSCESLAARIASSEQDAVKEFFRTVFKNKPEKRSVKLVSKETFFKKCYLLNRFLVLLICARREYASSDRTHLPGGELINVRDSRIAEFDPATFDLHGKEFGRIVPRLGIYHSKPEERDGILYVEKNPTS